MGTLQNTDTIKEIKEVTKLQASIDGVPNTYNNIVQLTSETNPKLLKEINTHLTLAAVNGVANLTLDTTKDFNVLALQYSFTKDAVSTCNSSIVYGTSTYTNATIYLISHAELATTAASRTYNFTYTRPIKLKKGTTVNISLDAAGANIKANLVLLGYYDEIGA